jgi:hypothetical protein
VNTQNGFYEQVLFAVQNIQNNNIRMEDMLSTTQQWQQNRMFNDAQRQCAVNIENIFQRYFTLINNAITSEREELHIMLSEEIQELHEELIDLKSTTTIISDQVIETNKTVTNSSNLLLQMISGFHFLPSLFVILKDKSKIMFAKTAWKLIFLCPITLQPGHAYEFKKYKKWVSKVLPILQISLVMLKIAASVYGIPLPIPTNFKEYLTDNDLQSCFDVASTKMQDFIDKKVVEINTVKDKINKNEKLINEINPIVTQTIGNISEENFWSLRKLLCSIENKNENLISSWEPKQTGLKKTVSKKDGSIAWIQNDAKVIQKFHEDGKNTFKTIN